MKKYRVIVSDLENHVEKEIGVVEAKDHDIALDLAADMARDKFGNNWIFAGAIEI